MLPRRADRTVRTCSARRTHCCRAPTGRRVDARRDVVSRCCRAGLARLLTRTKYYAGRPPAKSSSIVSAAACCRAPANKRLQIKEIPFSLFPILFLGGRRYDIVIPTFSSFNYDYIRDIDNSYNCITIRYCTQCGARYYMHIMYATRPPPKPIDGRLTQFRQSSYAAVFLRGVSVAAVYI